MNKPTEFAWTFDQHERYAVLSAALEIFFKEQSPEILDVGGISPGRQGASTWFPVREIFKGRSVVLDIEFVRNEGFVQGDASALPFKDGSFDAVVAMDVIEHIPQDRREGVLKELGRVSRDLVLISAPKAGMELEEAEALLDYQVQALFGTRHTQLEEHRKYGLPTVEQISGFWKSSGFCESGFSFGSLGTWMFFQSLRHGLLMKPESESVLAKIDWFAVEYLKCAEFREPLIHHFWAASCKRDRRELAAGIEGIREGLKEKGREEQKDGPREIETLTAFNKILTQALFPEKVSGVILVESGGENLKVCLQHLLTQKVYFPFEIAVWNLGENLEIEGMVKTLFPAVTYLNRGTNDSLSFRGRMLEVFYQLQGDHILFLDEEVLLPQDALVCFYDERRRHPFAPVINPGCRCLFMRKSVFSEGHWDEKRMGSEVKALKKTDIFDTFLHGLQGEHSG
jgi:SAM-dependent methyltransferase